jgi:hypothetical protein
MSQEITQIEFDLEIITDPELIDEKIELLDDLSVVIEQEKNYEVSSDRSDGTLIGVIVQLAQNVNDNKDFLMVLFGAAKTALDFLGKERERRAAKGQKVKVSLEVDGKSIEIEGDTKEVAQIVSQFQTEHPETAKKVTAKSKVKVKGELKAK